MLHLYKAYEVLEQSLYLLFPTSPGAPAPTGTKPDERPNRSTLPVDSQSGTKASSSSTTTPTYTSNPSDIFAVANNNTVTVPPKLPAMRSRALSLQARTTATGVCVCVCVYVCVCACVRRNQMYCCIISDSCEWKESDLNKVKYVLMHDRI